MCSLKKRAVNFSSKEETLLVSLVKQYKDIIECKMTDTRTHQDKADCWQKIEGEFNGTCGEVYRPKEVLRKKYDNIKKRVKKYAEERCYIRCTGGGPPKETKFTDIDSEIKEMLGRRIEGMSSEFDGDADDDLMLHTSVNTEATESDLLEIVTLPLDDHPYSIIEIPDDNNTTSNCLNAEIEIHDPEPTPSSSNVGTDTSKNVTNIETWSKYTPKMLRSKKSATLQIKNRAGKTKEAQAASEVGNRVSQWATAKTLLEESKNKFLSEESILKLKCIKEKHEEEIRLMKEKAQIEMQQMTEEHKLKMEVLRLEKA